jgi:hypothetical protein
MGCECDWGSSSCGKIVRTLNILAGAFLIAVGILRFFFIVGVSNSFTWVLLSVYYMYY